MPATNLSSKLDLRQIKVPSIFNTKTNGADNHGIIEEEFNFQNGSAEDVGVQPVNKAYIGKEDDVKLFWAAFKEIDRYRNLDRVLSSYHNTVTVACLEVSLYYIFQLMKIISFVGFLEMDVGWSYSYRFDFISQPQQVRFLCLLN